MPGGGVDDGFQGAEIRRRQIVETGRNTFVVAVGCEEILRQVIGADLKKIGRRADFIELPLQGRHLDHDAKLQG